MDRDEVLADHTLLDRALRERELFLDAIQANPVPVVVYDENEVLAAWNSAYEDLHPEAFASSAEAIEARTFTYRDLMRFRVDQSLPPDEIERQIDDAVEERNNGGREAELREIDALAASNNQEDAECVLLHIDLDWFKEVNDLLGHAAGDHVLCEVASILQRLTRSEDLVVRLGGDEFLVLLVGTRDVDFGLQVARQIMSELRHPFYFIPTARCSLRVTS